MKKTLAMILAFVMIFAMFTGIANADDAKPYAGETITVLAASTTFSNWWNNHLEEFTEATGINVEFEVLSNDQLNSKILVSMAAGGKDLDVYMFAAYQNTKLYVENGWLEPLGDYIDEDFMIDDIYSAPLALCQVDGVTYGIPHGAEYSNITYNKTMINDAGIDINSIKTWDDLIAACAQVEEKLDGVHGMAMRGQGNAAVTIIINLVRDYGGDFLDKETNTALINSEAWKIACEKYMELMKYAQEGVNTANWSESANAFAQRLCAFRFDSNSQYTYLNDPTSSLVETSELGFMLLPEGTEGTFTTAGNWAAGISSGSEHKGAAWEFIKYFENPNASLERQLAIGKNPVRKSVAENPEMLKVYPEGYLENSVACAETVAGGSLPDMTYASEARAALAEALDNIFLGGDIMSNLEAANEVVQELLDEEAES